MQSIFKTCHGRLGSYQAGGFGVMKRVSFPAYWGLFPGHKCCKCRLQDSLVLCVLDEGPDFREKHPWPLLIRLIE